MAFEVKVAMIALSTSFSPAEMRKLAKFRDLCSVAAQKIASLSWLICWFLGFRLKEFGQVAKFMEQFHEALQVLIPSWNFQLFEAQEL